MSTAPQRAKSSQSRAKAVPPRGSPGVASGEIAMADATIGAVFAGLPGAPHADTALPSVVLDNRRGRARQRLLDSLRTRGPYPVPENLRSELRMLVERWARKSFEDAFPDADDFEIRCAEERTVLDAEAEGDQVERFAAAERAYRRQVHRKHGRIEIRGLQLSARVYQDLEIAYVKLNVEGSPLPPLPVRPKKKSASKKPKSEAAAIDVDAMMAMLRAQERPRLPVTEALAKHPRLLLVGAPGSGKSTLLAYLAAGIAERDLAMSIGWRNHPVPFLLPARSLRGPSTLVTLAAAADAEPWFLESALRAGRALLLVDGLDETLPATAAALIATLTANLDLHAENRTLVTTRPASTPG
ncbi:MAG: NACHT domain-containing protein, partial [Byssovorax sp.]